MEVECATGRTVCCKASSSLSVYPPPTYTVSFICTDWMYSLIATGMSGPHLQSSSRGNVYFTMTLQVHNNLV